MIALLVIGIWLAGGLLTLGLGLRLFPDFYLEGEPGKQRWRQPGWLDEIGAGYHRALWTAIPWPAALPIMLGCLGGRALLTSTNKKTAARSELERELKQARAEIDALLRKESPR